MRETTRQVVCRSNVRQLGIGIAIYAEDQKDQLPSSQFAPAGQIGEAHRTTLVRHSSPVQWDGLGILFGQDYLPAVGVFYCPSHTGDHPMSRYAPMWPNQTTGIGEIICNYQYRGHRAGRLLSIAQRGRPIPALISDGLMTRSDYNHRVGANVLKADLAVLWFKDLGGQLVAEQLPVNENDADAREKVSSAWERLDQPTPIQ